MSREIDVDDVPKLRDGDPVVVIFDGLHWRNRHFHSFNHGGIRIYGAGVSNWTNTGYGIRYSIVWTSTWRLPTKQELSKAGYTVDQIDEMMTRWGTEQPKNKTHRAWHELTP